MGARAPPPAAGAAGRVRPNADSRDCGRGVHRHTTGPGESASIDANRPVVSGVTVSPAEGVVKVGDVLTLSFAVDDGASDNGMLAGSSVLVNGAEVRSSLVPQGNGNYEYRYVVAGASWWWLGCVALCASLSPLSHTVAARQRAMPTGRRTRSLCT